MPGKLILCGTPIGNLEDMTPRAVRSLKEADLIAAEDTRNSMKLLDHFDIHTPMTSYHEFNRIEKARTLIDAMKQGKNVALITDAGMPAVSDPGEDLVRMCHQEGIEVTCAPGPSACVTALALAGMPSRRFAFEAFLPMEKKERKAVLEEMKTRTATTILYEAPHRLTRTLQELYSTLGDRPLGICRELTKVHETVSLTTLGQAVSYYETTAPRGEYVLLVGGRDRKDLARQSQEAFSQMDLEEHMQIYLDQGLDRKEAMKAVAKDRGLSKRDIYQMLLPKT